MAEKQNMAALSMRDVELPVAMTIAGHKLRAGWCAPDYLVVSRVDLEHILGAWTGKVVSFSPPSNVSRTT